MRNSLTCILVVPSTLVVLIAMLNSPAIAENIDPRNDGSQYAWAENVGWLNAEPNGDEGSGIQVGDDELSGWMWGENIGWISLSCKNTLSCGTEPYWVTNDGSGVVAGYAWSETEGWLSFSCENTATCGDVAYGVTIDPATGDLSGRAWGENIGWVIFASPVASPFKVKSGWVCDPLPAAPSGTPTMLTLSKPANDPHLSWNAVVGATGHDIISGDLATLRSTGGDFSALTVSCLDDNRTTRTISSGELLDPGDGLWFLVRGQNCGGNGTYDSGGPSQVGLRDAEIATSGADCP